MLDSGDGDEEVEDEGLDMARDVVRLEIMRRSGKGGALKMDMMKEVDLFDDALLSTPTTLTITVPSPLNLFLTPSEAEIYSAINAYLLSIRRAHLHLSGLWKLSVLRRTHPAPVRPAKLGDPSVRGNANQRNLKMRSYWAAISLAVFFLTELGGYFHGQVITESWTVFREWIEPSTNPNDTEPQERDPENLTSAHRLYLKALTHALLLDDMAFAKFLRLLLTRCDRMVALATRLNTVEQTLQTSERMPNSSDETGAPAHVGQEEAQLFKTLTGAAHDVDVSIKELVSRLNSMDLERVGEGFSKLQLNESKATEPEIPNSGFIPWRSTGVRNLLMRLEFRTTQDD